MFALLPEDLRRLGHGGDPEVLFGQLQRVARFERGQPKLGRRAAALLEPIADFELPHIVKMHPSADGSTRLVLQTHDGHLFETVHMPRNTRNPRVTLCLSSQIGCAMGCTFCATGTMGIVRNLSAGEIVGQVLRVLLALGPTGGQQLNLVFMGMGEPLHNLDHVTRAIEVLCHPSGLGVSARRITVSTSGLVPGIERLARTQPRPLLAVSVNHTTDEARSAVMPVNKKYPLARLKDALRSWPLRPKERLTLEYVLLRGHNDTEDDAERLATFADGLHAHINLIPMNEHPHSAFARPDDNHVQRFAKRLMGHGLLVLVRDSRGRDIAGACGQLVTASRRGSTASLPVVPS